MKQYIILPLLLILFNWAAAQKFVLVKCISGDCQNGQGTAQFTSSNTDYISGNIVYKGNFKDGKMSGEGTITDDDYYSHYYIGNFDDNYYRGYGTSFQLKKVGSVMVPDSTGWVEFCKWDEDGCNIRLTVQKDNAKVPQRFGNNKKHKRFWDNSALKDEWLMGQAKALLASGARGYVPQYEESILAQKNISAPKGRATTLITWDCLADRQYFVTASATANGKYAAMPFGGHVDYQVSSEDGTVVFEGPVDHYWKPLKDGKYVFIIKFNQDQIVGNGNLNVDGVSLNCSLRARRQL